MGTEVHQSVVPIRFQGETLNKISIVIYIYTYIMIKSLSEEAVARIGTSVVLQNLHSFIKELIENSIDAKATTIWITFNEFGRGGFEVSDNGSGISFAESHNVSHKGGTSKLSDWTDITMVDTLGFRGEALNAIAHLSKMKLSSRHQDDDMGWSKQFWDALKPERIAKEQGTTVTVTDLFYTLPVRKLDFDKNCKAQYTKTISLINEYCIIHHDIEFKVWNQEPPKLKQMAFNSGSSQSIVERIQSVLGQNFYESLMEITVNQSTERSLVGFIQKTIQSGSIQQSKKNIQYCYLNKRPINPPKPLLFTLNNIFRQYNPSGRLSFILEFRYSQPKEIDFNVSVDKRDVYLQGLEQLLKTFEERIKELLDLEQQIGGKSIENVPKKSSKAMELEQPLQKRQQTMQEDVSKPRQAQQSLPLPKQNRQSGFLTGLIGTQNRTQSSTNMSSKSTYVGSQQQVETQRQSFQEKPSISEISSPPQKVIILDQPPLTQTEQQPNIDIVPFQNTDFGEFGQSVENDGIRFQGTNVPFLKDNFKDLLVLGQYNKGFIVCLFDIGRQILILDQHACDEKRNYETLMNKFNPQPTILIQPFRIELQGYETDLAETNRRVLESLGYRFTSCGRLISLTALPTIHKHVLPANSFQEALQNISDGIESSIDILPRAKLILATQACHSSITVGEELNLSQMKRICSSMGELNAPWNCPHGRPTFVRVSQDLCETLIKIAPAKGFNKTIYQNRQQ